MPPRDVLDRLLEKDGKAELPQLSDEPSGHRRSSGAYNRNSEPDHHQFGKVRNNFANTASKFVVAAKSLIACAHDELRQRIVVLWSRTPPERDRGRPWPKAGFGLGRDLNQKTGDYVIGE